MSFRQNFFRNCSRAHTSDYTIEQVLSIIIESEKYVSK